MKTKVILDYYGASTSNHQSMFGRSIKSREIPKHGAEGYIDGYAAAGEDMYANVIIDGKIYAISIGALKVITDDRDD